MIVGNRERNVHKDPQDKQPAAGWFTKVTKRAPTTFTSLGFNLIITRVMPALSTPITTLITRVDQNKTARGSHFCSRVGEIPHPLKLERYRED